MHENLSENAQIFSKLSNKELLAFSFAYKGSSLHIQQMYKNIFKKCFLIFSGRQKVVVNFLVVCLFHKFFF